MKTILYASLTLFLTYGGFYFFKESLAQAFYDLEKSNELALAKVVLKVGREEPCIVEINLTSWSSMNELGIYRWVTACEDAQREVE